MQDEETVNEVTPPRVRLFGIDLDALTSDQAVRLLIGWIRARDGRCRYVVTPNVDHVLLYQSREDLRRAYADAALVLADGAPVVWASHLFRKPVPERVAGSDLTPALLEATRELGEISVFLLGAAPGVAERAASHIHARYAHVRVVGTHSPPYGFEHDPKIEAEMLRLIRVARPDVLVVGLGAPKQELWVHRHRNELEAAVVLCVGATIDFLAGEKTRAPPWMQRTGLEWVHRALGEPRRLMPRYAKNMWSLPGLVWRELAVSVGSRGRSSVGSRGPGRGSVVSRGPGPARKD